MLIFNFDRALQPLGYKQENQPHVGQWEVQWLSPKDQYVTHKIMASTQHHHSHNAKLYCCLFPMYVSKGLIILDINQLQFVHYCMQSSISLF